MLQEWHRHEIRDDIEQRHLDRRTGTRPPPFHQRFDKLMPSAAESPVEVSPTEMPTRP